jgi:tetratricopeptide (TPR) repeat protein
MSTRRTEKRPARAQAAKHPQKSKPVSSGSSGVADRLKTAGRSIIAWRGFYLLVPVLLALLASINTLECGFAHDDLLQVLNNEFIKNIDYLPYAFTTSVWSFMSENIRATTDLYYRPMFAVLFTFNYALFNTNAWAWHLVNILIHAGVSLEVFIVIREVTRRKWVSLTAAAIFAVHPVHALSVAWISGATDPLMALFFLPAFLCYLRYRQNGRKLLLVVALAAYFLALLSKETALALPLVFAYFELAHNRERSTLKKRVIATLLMAAVFSVPSVLYFFMRYNVIGSVLVSPDRPVYPLGWILITQPIVIAKYLWLMAAPVGYSFQHYTALVGSVGSASFLAPCALLVVIALALFLIKSRELNFAVVWFIATLAPSLAAARTFHPVSMVQERYLYLPSIGFCFAVALGIEWLAARKLRIVRMSVLAPALTAALIVLLSVVTIEQNMTWLDTLTLFRHCVAANPTAPFARTALSTAYFVAGMKREAQAEARTAIDLDPSCIDAYVNLGYFARAAGKLDEALDHINRAKTAVTDEPEKKAYEARLNHDAGLLYEQKKEFELAEENLRRAVELRPSAPNFYDLAGFYFDRGRYEEAREMYEEASRHASRFGPIHQKLGQTYDRLGQAENARLEYRIYLELTPYAKDRSEVMRRLARP